MGAELVIEPVVRPLVEQVDVMIGQEPDVVAHPILGRSLKVVSEDSLRGSAHALIT